MEFLHKSIILCELKESDQLIYIKNSDEFPNLRYNKVLNCIDAFRVYAGCMTEFLTIQGDSLEPFASVELYNGLTVIEYDRNGNGKVLLKDTSNRRTNIRYQNYNPLIESKEN